MKNHKQIKDLSCESFTSNMIKFKGPDSALEILKKKLTLTNKSIAYRVRWLQKDQAKWKGRSSEFSQKRMADIKKELDEIMPQMSTEYWAEHKDGVVAPAGFWFLAENVTDMSQYNMSVGVYNIPGQRLYQQEANEEILKYKRAMCVLATGLGKTRVLMSTALSMVKFGKRVIIVVPTKDLVEQFLDTALEYHDSVTGAHSDRKPKLGQDIMIVSAGSAKRYVDSYQCILVDETHHIVAKTWAEMLGTCESAEYVYGFTATPFRSDGLDLAIHAFAGPIVYERDLIWGIQNSWLEHFDVYRIHLNAEVKIDGRMQYVRVGDSSLAATAYKKICSNEAFLDKVAPLLKKAHGNGRKVIGLFKTLKAAEMLAKKVKGEIGCQVANAKWKKPLADFREGKANVLLATSKLVGEGIDIPDADMLLTILQNSSDAMTYQALGRILRKKDGKKKPIVIDVIANGYKSFRSSSLTRLKVWQKAADNVYEIDGDVL